jgi:hypothetical protein
MLSSEQLQWQRNENPKPCAITPFEFQRASEMGGVAHKMNDQEMRELYLSHDRSSILCYAVHESSNCFTPRVLKGIAKGYVKCRKGFNQDLRGDCKPALPKQ